MPQQSTSLHARRIPQTFECRPTAPGLPNDVLPDELMINWGGIPAGGEASIFLPAVSADAILSLARRLYFGKPFTRVDGHTIRCKMAGLTYVPIPSGPQSGLNFAGLLTLHLPEGLPQGQRYTVSIRQLTTVAQDRDRSFDAFVTLHKVRKARGGFQVDVTIQSPNDLVIPIERSLSFFRWNLSTRSVSDRWYPVLLRYISELEGCLVGLGRNPDPILPSPIGAIPGDPKAGGTPAGTREWTGKVERLVYDRFGDFESFVLETDRGEKVHFHSRDGQIAELVWFVWEARTRVTVVASDHQRHVPEQIILIHS
jgi:hypothetical protein